MDNPALKLTYFDIAGGRGEDCRLALFIAGVEFEDHRIPFSAWPQYKAGTPFGGLPTLERDGVTLGQSNAILVYIGRSHGLHPTDPWEAARHEALMAAVEELRTEIAGSLYVDEPDERRRVREALARGPIQTWGANVEQQLQGPGPFVAGDALSVVDLKLFVFCRWFASGVLDHIPRDVLSSFPRLGGVHDAVKAHPKVVEWYARAPASAGASGRAPRG